MLWLSTSARLFVETVSGQKFEKFYLLLDTWFYHRNAFVKSLSSRRYCPSSVARFGDFLKILASKSVTEVAKIFGDYLAMFNNIALE